MAKSYQEEQQDSFLGVGWGEDPFTRELVLDKTGDMSSVSGLANFSNAIYRRLKTPLGWYPEYPWYGSRLNDMIGMGNTYENRSLIVTWIEESLLFEKRIMDGTIETEVTKNPSDHRAVDIVIRCRIISWPSPESFVYSFFLNNGVLVPAT